MAPSTLPFQRAHRSFAWQPPTFLPRCISSAVESCWLPCFSGGGDAAGGIAGATGREAAGPHRGFANRIAAGDLSARVEEGNLDEISAVAHALDVTASRLEQSFHALESSRSELTALLDSMQEAVIAINPQGQVSWCNAVMQRIAFSPVQEGRALVHSIRDPEVLASVSFALTDRQASRGRAISVVPGKVFEVNAAPMPGGGAVAVLHDVSEKERSETTRRDFVANVSHELRTPLTCITGYVETLLDDRGLSDQTREFLQIILKNASRMNRLTEDLLALASVESGDYKLRLQKVQAARLVEEAVASLAGLVLDSDLTLEVGGDHRRIRHGRSRRTQSGLRKPGRECHEIRQIRRPGEGRSKNTGFKDRILCAGFWSRCRV